MIAINSTKIQNENQVLIMKKENSTIPSFSKIQLSQKEKEWLQKLEDNVYRYIDDPLFNMEFLGKKMGISRRQLQRDIKKTLGITPKIYLKEIRLSIAFQMLSKEENISIKEIARKVGFANRDYFSKLFKERYGVLPSKYIKSSNK